MFLCWVSLCCMVSYCAECHNGKESTINRALGGSTYPGWKLVHSPLCKKKLVVIKHSNLYLGLVLPSGGWQCLISQYDWSHSAESQNDIHSAKCRYFKCGYTECCYVECHKTERHCDEFRYADRCWAQRRKMLQVIKLCTVAPRVVAPKRERHAPDRSLPSIDLPQLSRQSFLAQRILRKRKAHRENLSLLPFPHSIPFLSL
jgi:hypothetical protein